MEEKKPRRNLTLEQKYEILQDISTLILGSMGSRLRRLWTLGFSGEQHLPARSRSGEGR